METTPSTERTGPQKGDVIDGSLEIEAIVAEGNTSVVCSATDRETGSKVAVKIARGSDLESLERFRRAARAMERLKSPFTVKVLAVGQTQDGLPCMSMEYLEGKTLALTLLQRGALPIDDAVRWIKQAAESLVEAHSKSFLHRDLDAENLFLAVPPRGLVGPPSIRVLDYGLSPVWRTNKAEGRLKPGEVPGTSFALAPELVRGSDLDERVDIWGLGITLYRLLTNKYPFTARNLAELCAKLLAERAPDVSKVRPEVTPALAAVVKRCLEPEPDDRFPSVKALIIALDEAQDDAPHTPQVPTERVVLDHLRDAPGSEPGSADEPTGMFAPNVDEPTGLFAPTPQTIRVMDPITEDGPSTQPLGRLSPFAELPRRSPAGEQESKELMPSSSELSIAPQLTPFSDKFAVPPRAQTSAPPRAQTSAPPPKAKTTSAPPPKISEPPKTAALPKVSPQLAAQETVARGLPRVSAATQAQETMAALPKVSPAMAAQETIPAGATTQPPRVSNQPPRPSPQLSNSPPTAPYESPMVFQAAPRTLAMPSQMTGPPPPQPIMTGPPPPQPRALSTLSGPPPVLAVPNTGPQQPIMTGPPPPMMTPPQPSYPAPRAEASQPAPPLEDVGFAVEEAPKKSRRGIVILFAFGIAASIVVGLYAAKAKIAKGPLAMPSASVTPSPSETFSVTATEPVPTTSSTTTTPPADSSGQTVAANPNPIPTAEVDLAVPTATHHRRPARPPVGTTTATTATAQTTAPANAPTPARSGSIYDPTLYDQK